MDINDLTNKLKGLSDKDFEEKLNEIIEIDLMQDQGNVEYHLNEIFKNIPDSEKKRFVDVLDDINKNNRNVKDLEYSKMSEIKKYKEEQEKKNKKEEEPEQNDVSTPDSPESIVEDDRNIFEKIGDKTGEVVSKIKENIKAKKEELDLDNDGPALKAYMEETEEKVKELEALKLEKEELTKYAKKIEAVASKEDLENIKEEMNNTENNYSDKLKNAINILINNKDNIYKQVDKINEDAMNVHYNALKTNSDNNPNDQDLKAQLQKYEVYEKLIKANLLKDADAFDKEIIEKLVKGSTNYATNPVKDPKNLSEELGNELLDKLNLNIDNTMDYNDIIANDHTEKIEELNAEIKDRNDVVKQYKSVIRSIKRLDNSKDPKKEQIEIDIINKVIPNMPDELKTELCQFVNKYLIDNKKLSRNDFSEDVKKELRTKEAKDTDDIELDMSKRKLIPDEAPALKAYMEETDKKVEEIKNLEELKTQYEQIISDIKNANSVDMLETIKPAIDSFAAEPQYFKDALETAYNDKQQKLGGITNDFEEEGKRYTALKEKYDKLNNKINKTPKEEAEFKEIENNIKAYDEIVRLMKNYYNNKMNLDDLLPIIESNPNLTDDKLKEELKEKIDKIKNTKIENKYTEEDLLKLFDNDITGLENVIKERKATAEKYKNIEEKIKQLREKIRDGLDKESDEAKDIIDEIKADISGINEPSLQEELSKKLEKSLKPRKKITEFIKRHDILGKALSTLAGIGLGFAAGSILSVPASIILGAGLMIGKHVLGKFKEKNLREQHKLTVEAIEKPSSELTEKIEKLKKHEKWMERASWGLTGVTIGLTISSFTKAINNTTTTNTAEAPIKESGVSKTPVNPEPSPTDIKIGDSASGLDLSTGYDSAGWAANGINAETLNQTIMTDGNSVVSGFGIVQSDGTVNVIEAAGKSLSEVAAEKGVDVSQIALKVTDNLGRGRAWVSATDALNNTVGAVGRGL